MPISNAVRRPKSHSPAVGDQVVVIFLPESVNGNNDTSKKDEIGRYLVVYAESRLKASTARLLRI